MSELITLDTSIEKARQRPKPVTGFPKQLPSFREWRRTNDVAMVPDRGFRKQLHCLNKELEVVWDWGSSKWEIWRFPEDGSKEHHVLTVETKDKTYREVGVDVLLQLKKGLEMATWSLNHLVDYFDELDKQVTRRKAKVMRDVISDITRETINYQMGVLQVQVPKEIRVRRIIANA